jgi:hypothetical protein
LAAAFATASHGSLVRVLLGRNTADAHRRSPFESIQEGVQARGNEWVSLQRPAAPR